MIHGICWILWWICIFIRSSSKKIGAHPTPVKAHFSNSEVVIWVLQGLVVSTWPMSGSFVEGLLTFFPKMHYNVWFISNLWQILNVVTLSGVGLCLKASSKISHLHRRIVKAATSMHARITFETGNMPQIQTDKHDINTILERLNTFCKVQDECCRRAALGKQIENLTVLIYFVFCPFWTIGRNLNVDLLDFRGFSQKVKS